MQKVLSRKKEEKREYGRYRYRDMTKDKKNKLEQYQRKYQVTKNKTFFSIV